MPRQLRKLQAFLEMPRDFQKSGPKTKINGKLMKKNGQRMKSTRQHTDDGLEPFSSPVLRNSLYFPSDDVTQ